MNILKQLIIIISIVVLLSVCGCRAGSCYRYQGVVADLDAGGAETVAVTVQDKRRYIVNGDKAPDFAGLIRSGFGIPYGYGTESGNPLAYDMTQCITDSLSKKGFKAISVETTPSDSLNTVIVKLKKTGADKFLLLTLYEWKTDTYQGTALIYDVKAAVLDNTGKTIGESSINGRDNLGRGGFWELPFYHARTRVPEAFKKKMELLLNNSNISSALK